MLVLNLTTGAGRGTRTIPTTKCKLLSSNQPLNFTTNPTLYPKPRFTNPRPKPLRFSLAKPDSTTVVDPSKPDNIVSVGNQNVPLEGVIQFDKPSSSSRINKWGRVALLAGGDVLALLLFSSIGRFSHGLPIFTFETLRTADPFIAGWFLSAYFLGGYGEDGRGMNGLSKAVTAAAKSWLLGIPLGLLIRAGMSGHVPPYNFVFVTIGSTAVLLVGWRTLIFSILPTKTTNKDDVYRRGSPFELFELLTSLVRRW